MHMYEFVNRKTTHNHIHTDAYYSMLVHTFNVYSYQSTNFNITHYVPIPITPKAPIKAK